MKKRRDFLQPNKTKLWHLFISFSRTAVEQRGPIKKKEESPPRLIRQTRAEALCDALNAPQFKPIGIIEKGCRIKCTALNETACIKCNAVFLLRGRSRFGESEFDDMATSLIPTSIDLPLFQDRCQI